MKIFLIDICAIEINQYYYYNFGDWFHSKIKVLLIFSKFVVVKYSCFSSA